MRKNGDYRNDRAARQRLEEYVGEFATQREAALKLRISQAFLSEMLGATRRVPERILRQMGYRREIKVVRIGA